jgi:hypothetical protein
VALQRDKGITMNGFHDCYVLEDMGYDSDPHRIKLIANEI